MAEANALLSTTSKTTTLGNDISLEMTTFLQTVKDQPSGFRDLGLDFLSISQILNALEESLSSHFKTQQPFPRQAVPELTKILSKTLENFERLQSLLRKFMDYERGGALGRLQKTWRIMFADKDIAKVRAALQESKGAFTMTLLLTNINPINTSLGHQYEILAAKLQDQEVPTQRITSSPPPLLPPRAPPPAHPEISELPGEVPHELAGSSFPDTAIYSTSSSKPNNSAIQSPSHYNDTVAPSVSDLSISDRIPEPSIVSSLETQTPEPQSAIEEVQVVQVPHEQVSTLTEEIPSTTPPPIIHIDRSKLQFRKPTQTSGAGNASLKKALLSAITGSSLKIIEQLLTRGVSPDTGPEKNALIEATRKGDLTSLNLLLEFGADPNIKATDGNLPIRTACQYKNSAAAELLLRFGADANLSSPDMTALPWALREKDEETVSLLLQYGADPNLEMFNGETSLIFACDREGITVNFIEQMLTYGVDPNTKNRTKRTPLHVACSNNRADVVKVLLAHGADPNIPAPTLPIEASVRFPTCLELLIKAGADLSKRKGVMEIATNYNAIESVRVLLEAGVDPNEKSQNIYSPLSTAIRDNRSEIVTLLLSHGADPNMKGQEMPLFLATQHPPLLRQLLTSGALPSKSPGVMENAVYRNKLESVQILLDAGVDPNEKNQGIYSPIATAIRDNRPEILALLLERGADPNLKGQEMPLMIATYRGGFLKQLIEGGADASKCPGIMEYAVYRNKIESVKYLLDLGVNPNDKKEGIYTPLTTAIRDNRPEILTLLLERGADPNFVGQQFPLIQSIPHPDLLKQLLAAGADVKQYKGLIENAVYQNKPESISILLEAGADINEKHHNIYTPLTTALRDNRISTLKLLLEKGADPEVVGQGKPVVMAAGFKDGERLRILIDAGAKVDGREKEGGKTALMVCVEVGNLENVKFLIGKGADVNLVDGLGRSAVDFAAEKGQDEILGVLLESMG